jgi:hypothetical protein
LGFLRRGMNGAIAAELHACRCVKEAGFVMPEDNIAGTAP